MPHTAHSERDLSNVMNYINLTQTLVDSFHALADEVQALTDRKTILEHKLRFAHEQYQKPPPPTQQPRPARTRAASPKRKREKKDADAAAPEPKRLRSSARLSGSSSGAARSQEPATPLREVYQIPDSEDDDEGGDDGDGDGDETPA
ncbi:hypothetical protein HYQ44_000845 [Verticillium longisporum]|nr:hypothetical protein HYQ44_000845 [Verticillium longisporum]